MASHIVVVMPTTDTGAWFDVAVRSVLSGLGPDDELMIVFDGVDPRLPEDVTDRVIWLHNRARSGVANALATGIANTSSRYIARLDADDISRPGRFSIQAEYLDSHADTVLVATEATRIDENGLEVGEFGALTGADIRASLLKRNGIVHSTVMFRRSVYEEVGGYDIELQQMEDYELWLRFGCLGKIAALDRSLVDYRLHGGQVSRRARPVGSHISKIRKARFALARAVGVPAIVAFGRHYIWLFAQALRYFGVRRAGYDRART